MRGHPVHLLNREEKMKVRRVKAMLIDTEKLEEQEFDLGNEEQGISILVSSKGIEVAAWYDCLMKVKGGFIPWKKIIEEHEKGMTNAQKEKPD